MFETACYFGTANRGKKAGVWLYYSKLHTSGRRRKG
jgi:hypothetical protein